MIIVSVVGEQGKWRCGNSCLVSMSQCTLIGITATPVGTSSRKRYIETGVRYTETVKFSVYRRLDVPRLDAPKFNWHFGLIEGSRYSNCGLKL